MADKMIPDSVPFSRSYWVVPGKLLAGCYPGSEDNEQAYGKLKALLDHSIRHVINLMEPGEINWSGRSFVSYEGHMKAIAASVGETVTFDRMPIKDGWVPQRIGMIEILDRIDQSINDGKPVYIHCWGGRGRTGTVVCCYLIRHGLAQGHNAIDRIHDLRKRTEDHDEPSPEGTRQVEMVLSWVEGE